MLVEVDVWWLGLQCRLTACYVLCLTAQSNSHSRIRPEADIRLVTFDWPVGYNTEARMHTHKLALATVRSLEW